MQPLAILFGAGFTVAVCFSLGAILLRNSCSDPAARFVTGAPILSLFVFLAGIAGAVSPALYLAAGGVAIFAARSEWRIGTLPRPGLWALLYAPFLILYFTNAMAPEISFDGSRYHLGLVSRYLREHAIHAVPENFYAALPEGVEMLYLFAFAFGRHSAAALVHFAFLLALCRLVYVWGRETGRPVAGRVAAALVFFCPAVGVVGTTAYVDVAVAAIVFTMFYVLERWRATDSVRLLAAAGLLAGFSFGAKYTAALAIPYAAVYALWRRSLRPAAIVAGFAAWIAAPWLLRNAVWYGNPAAPFFNQWFRNPFFSYTFESGYRASLQLYGLHSRWEIPGQLIAHGSLGGLLGPVFALAPVGLVALRWPEGRRVLLAGTVIGATYFTNISVRFLLPALPFLALAVGMGLAMAPRFGIAIVVLHAILSWPPVLRRYCRPDAWHLVKVPYREALRIKPEEGFLQSNLPDYGATRLVEQTTPPGATVFTETPIPEAYTSRKILVAYQSAANTVSRYVWFSGFVPEHAPTHELRFTFPRRPVRSIRVTQTSNGQANWAVNEVRAFDGGRELPRAGWTGTAQPYPWGIGAVLDGRPVSFWMSGEAMRPGERLDLNLGSLQALDSIRIITAPGQWEARMALEVADESGAWSGLPAGEDVEIGAPSELRKQAALELRRRGIDYVLAFDGQFGADDLWERASDWGIREVGRYQGARLYQLP